MKNKKSLLSLGILTLVLVLGVGYAVVSSVDLSVNGTAKVQGVDLKVAFNGTTEVSSKDKVTATATDGSLTANITVKDLTLNETVTATYTIKNTETDVDASLIQKSVANDKDEYFQVTTDATTAKTISAGGTTTVTVSVKLIKTPVLDADSTANIKVNLTATPVQK